MAYKERRHIAKSQPRELLGLYRFATNDSIHMEQDLLVPWAIGGSKLIKPRDAVSGESYTCPACFDYVFVRRGDAKQDHFAHFTERGCHIGGETWKHLYAKDIIFEALNSSTSGYKINLKIHRACEECKTSHSHFVPLNPELGKPALEHVFDGVSGARIITDVAIIRDDAVRLSVEIKATNPINPGKIDDLGETPWVELDADQVTKSTTGTGITPLRSGNMKPWANCSQHSKHTNPGWSQKATRQNTRRKRYRAWEKRDLQKPQKYEMQCPMCDGKMVIKESNYGKFWGCTGYPYCKEAIPIRES